MLSKTVVSVCVVALGLALTLSASAQEILPFHLQQVSADSGGNGRLGNFKGRTSGIGPVLSYVLPRGPDNLVVELRWLKETNVSNRLEGDYLWLKMVYQF